MLPLVASVGTDLNIHRYVQTHTPRLIRQRSVSESERRMEPEHDGAAELWWTSEKELEQTLQMKAAQKSVQPCLKMKPDLLICSIAAVVCP
ncbi:MAG: EthD domain-containing protein [Candidatus Azotimanducaceae bacterium WSBS_2022_MAG_OTU7]